MKKNHIGNIIKGELEKQGRSVTWLARNLDISRSTMYSIFTRESIDAELLLNISEILRLDFLTYYQSEQNTIINFNKESILKLVESFIGQIQRIEYKSDVEVYMIALYIIYGVHKQYKLCNQIDNVFRYDIENDILLSEITERIGNLTTKNSEYCRRFYELLSKISREKFNICYLDIIEMLYEKVLFSVRKREMGVWTFSTSVHKLMAYLLLKENCKTFFDPFCGNMLILRYLYYANSTIKFEGQDVYEEACLFTRIFKEAYSETYDGIVCKDSLREWSSNVYDAVVSFPPLGRYYPKRQLLAKDYGRPITTNTYGYIFPIAFNSNNAKIVMSLEPYSFCFSYQYLDIRKYIVDNNYIDTVVDLPSCALMPNTATHIVLIVCNRIRKTDEPVKFICTDKFVEKNDDRTKSFNVEGLIQELENTQNNVFNKVTIDDIKGNKYNLHPSLYSKDLYKNYGIGKKYALVDFATIESGKKIINNNNIGYVTKYSNKFDEIIENQNKVSFDIKESLREHSRYYDGNKSSILIDNVSSNLRFALHTDGTSFLCSSVVKVVTVDEAKIVPEYLVYLFTNNLLFNTIAQMPISAYMDIPLFELVSIEEQYKILNKEKETLLKKSGENYEKMYRDFSEMIHLKKHSLLQTFSDIRTWYDDLLMPALEKYNDCSVTKKYTVGDVLNRIKDDFNQMYKKIESFTTADQYNAEKLNIYDSLKKIEKNKTNPLYRLNIVFYDEKIIKSTQVVFSEEALGRIFDNIISNAIQHGFEGRTANNEIRVLTRIDEDSSIVIEISNNGIPLAASMTETKVLQYSESTKSGIDGHYGLGGSEINQLVKKFGAEIHIFSTPKDYFTVTYQLKFKRITK